MTDPTVRRAARVWLVIGYVVLAVFVVLALLVGASLLQAALSR